MQFMRQLVSTAVKHTVIIPKEPPKGSYFGRFTYGLVKCDAVPCEHMTTIVVSSRIGVLTILCHFGGKGGSGRSNFLGR